MVWLEVVESRNQAGVLLCWLSVEDAVFVDCGIVLGSRFVVLFTRVFVLLYCIFLFGIALASLNCPGFVDCPGFFELPCSTCLCLFLSCCFVSNQPGYCVSALRICQTCRLI